MRVERSQRIAALLSGLLLAGSSLMQPAAAQTQAGCGPDGTQAVARRWDAVLGLGWELRQDCVHPEWPARLFALGPAAVGLAAAPVIPVGALRTIQVAQTVLRQTVQPQPRPIQTQIVPAQPAQSLLVHTGDRVRLWMRDATVHIEMSGVAEQSARSGEHVVVRISQQTEDAGLTVQRIPGIVRGAGDVEMER
jgi:hypothetical protein